MQIAGLVSGLQWDDLITQLLALEARPIQLAQARQSTIQKRIGAWQEINTGLSGVRSLAESLAAPSSFKDLEAVSANDQVVTGTASPGAQLGQYQIVVEHTAQAHAVRSNQQSQDALGLAGSFHIDGGDGLVQIDVIADDKLTDIRTKINDAGAGVTATLVDDHLVITRNATGATQIDFSDPDNVLESIGVLDANKAVSNELTAARDARIHIDGIAVERSSNTISDAIDGVTLNLHSASTDLEPTSLTVGYQDDDLVAKVNDFVQQYNSVLALMNKSGDVEQNGNLVGDPTLRTIVTRLRHDLANPVAGLEGSFDRLSEIGISTSDESGELILDESMLRDALAEDRDGVIELFTTENTGVAVILADSLQGFAGEQGLIAQRITSLEGNISLFDGRIESLERRLEMRERTLINQFTALERVIASMQSQEAVLGQFVNQLQS